MFLSLKNICSSNETCLRMQETGNVADIERSECVGTAIEMGKK